MLFLVNCKTIWPLTTYVETQLGFKAGHSIETALERVSNDLLMNADHGAASIFILLDLSAAFDTALLVSCLQDIKV